MREFRNTLWFMVGLLLAVNVTFAFAADETRPATQSASTVHKWGCLPSGGAYPSYPASTTTVLQACQNIGGSYINAGWCHKADGNIVCSIGGFYGYTYSCPPNENWTLSGTTCTRPACSSGQTRNPTTGICEGVACPTTSNSGWVKYEWGQDITGSYCSNSCGYSVAADIDLNTPSNNYQYETGTSRWGRYTVTGTGQSCTTGNAGLPTASATPPNTPTKETPCASGEGVIAMAGGKVYCVPGATPGADKPKVTTERKEDTKSDGSKVITETTNTCTGHGACSTTTTTTVTNNSSGQPGLAGTPGSSSSKTDKPASETSDFCAKNPSTQFCKGGMNEEATQKKVLTELERFNNPGLTDDSTLTARGKFSDTKTDALTDADTKLLQTAKGEITDTALSNNRSAWQSAMADGWFSSVTLTGCQPIVSIFAGRTWTLNHCPVAETISNYGAYAMWFMLLVSLFVMLTGGAFRS